MGNERMYVWTSRILVKPDYIPKQYLTKSNHPHWELKNMLKISINYFVIRIVITVNYS